MFHTLTVTAVTELAPGAVALDFAVPGTGFDWHPGQYLTLRATVGGEDIRRSYSIASLPGEAMRVGVKQVEGGAFSTFAQSLAAGDSIQVMPPEGRFVWRGESDVPLAAGARVTLVYGTRNFASILFRDTLDALKDRYLDRFTLIHVLSREPQDVPLLNGRITGDKIAALARAGALDLAAAEGVFLCGPGEMIDDVAATLSGLGVPEVRVHFERFFQEGEAPRAPRSAEAQAAAEAGATVEVILDGARRSFTVTAQDDTVLDAAARAGLELPYSCKGGMCCTCRCKVAEGAAEMAVNYSLQPWELDAGFTLACQTRPTTDRLVLDFDAA